MKLQNVERWESFGKFKCAPFKACATFQAKKVRKMLWD